jgi:hypothetical protein
MEKRGDCQGLKNKPSHINQKPIDVSGINEASMQPQCRTIEAGPIDVAPIDVGIERPQ